MLNEDQEYIYVSATCKANLKKREYIDVTDSKRKISLTDTEHRILEYIVRLDGEVATRDGLFGVICKGGQYGRTFDNNIDTHIKNIREKTSPKDRKDCYIKTVWGAGYQYLPVKRENIEAETVTEPKPKAPVTAAAKGAQRLLRRVSAEDAESIVSDCIDDFEASEGDELPITAMRGIIRTMNRLKKEQYDAVRDYFDRYLIELHRIGDFDSIKELACNIILLEFLLRECEAKISEYGEKLENERETDRREKLSQMIHELNDKKFDYSMDQEEYLNRMRGRTRPQSVFI